MISPNAWRGRAIDRGYSVICGVGLGLFIAFGSSATVAHFAGDHELAGGLLGMTVLSLVALAIFL